jgi:asparagine synthase (glutamine-hydrolysing)
MFALAIWDRERRTLFLARDRFGIKPLFFQCREGRIAFASELRSLLCGGLEERPVLDRLELRHYLAQKYVTPGGTIFAGVRSLPPATVLESGPAGVREYRWWSRDETLDATLSEDEALSGLAERLQAAATRQLVADVPVGLFLSGGLDSGTLATLVRRVHDESLDTFSVGFEGARAVSETSAARRVAEHLGTRHHELTLEAAEVAGDLEAILAGLDGPLGDATCIPTWYMSRLARETVTVALSGEGADEIFAGYPRQHYDALIDRLGPLGRAAVPAAMKMAGRAPSERLEQRLKMKPGLARQLDWSRVYTAEQIDALVTEPLPAEEELFTRYGDLVERWERVAAADPLNARLETDRELFLPGDLLPKVDRMSMVHSLEVRVPYLDHEVVDWMLRLPGRFKAGGSQGKLLLRRFSGLVLPKELVARRKQGFDVPISGWLRGPLREPLTDLLSEATLRRRGLFRATAVGRMLREHLEEEADHGERLWLLMALEGWSRQGLDTGAEGEG